MKPELEIACGRQDEVWRISLTGELTRNSEAPFFETYPWLHGQENLKCIFFDMSSLQYLNSAGIALLIRYVREARKREYSTYAYGVSAHYQKIFRIVGLTYYIEIFPDEYSAFETLQARRAYERSE